MSACSAAVSSVVPLPTRPYCFALMSPARHIIDVSFGCCVQNQRSSEQRKVRAHPSSCRPQAAASIKAVSRPLYLNRESINRISLASSSLTPLFEHFSFNINQRAREQVVMFGNYVRPNKRTC